MGGKQCLFVAAGGFREQGVYRVEGTLGANESVGAYLQEHGYRLLASKNRRESEKGSRTASRK